MIDAGNSRERLPTRRTGGSLDFAWGNIAATFTAGFALFPTGVPWRCAEVFINVTPSQSALEKEIRDAGILSSIALQHGASLDTLVDAVTHEEDGSASSLIGTALALVRDEIARLRVPPDDPSSPAGAVPPSAPQSGEGGEAVAHPGIADPPGPAAPFAAAEQ